MRTNAIMVCKQKLGSADAMLPIFLTIKERHPKTKFWVLFPTKETLELNRMNHELWSGLESLDPEVVVTKGRNKFFTVLILLRMLAAFAFCRNVLFKISDAIPAHRKFVSLLRLVSRVTELKYFTQNLWPMDGVRNMMAEYDLIYRHKGVEVDQNPTKGEYDYFLAAAPPDAFGKALGISVNRDKYVQTGFPRRFPAWQKFLEQTAAKDPVVQGPRYCLFIMASLGQRLPYLDEPKGIELFSEAVRALAVHQDELRIILKPHATTDVPLLEKVMSDCGVTNYSVEFAHAMVLATKAEFVIGYNYSTTMIDAYFLGRPVIEYCSTDPAAMELFDGGGSVSGGCHDFFIHRDFSRLEATLADLVSGRASVERDHDFMERSFPRIPDSFTARLDSLFG